MAYRQVIEPDLDPVLRQGNEIVTNWVGWCLLYTQTAFRAGWAGSDAWESWTERTGTRHEDRNIPGGVYVPIWFSGYHGLGHSAIYKDGQIWSTPLTRGYTAIVWNSIVEVEQKYGVQYAGWSEDIGGTQVIEYTPDTVIEPTPPPPTYQLLETYPDGKQIQLNKQPTNLWGMNYADPGALLPVEVHNSGEVWTVANKVHHQNGYDYYRREGQIDGFNILDCDDYTPPPYVPPAAPVVATPAHRYTLKTTMMTFPTAQDALSGTNALTTLKPQTYYVWADDGKAYQLGVDNIHQPEGNWINTIYNKEEVRPVPVEPAPQPKPTALKPSQVKIGSQSDNLWKSSYKAFYHDGHSDLYEVKQYLTMLDYSGKRNPVAIQPGNRVNVTGTFLKDGVMFYRTRSGRDEFFSWYYGISLYNDNGSIQIVKVVDTTPKITLKNIAYWVADDLRRWWDIKIKKEK